MQIEEPSASADNTLRDLHDFPYQMKAEFNNYYSSRALKAQNAFNKTVANSSAVGGFWIFFS